jgi:glycosyltransferase involved in cell wall biosynthesis
VRLAFVTTFCTHYRTKTYETLARYYDVDYYFFSAGDEWYWQQEHGVRAGRFQHEYLRGFRIAGTRVAPALPWQLWHGDYDVYVKCINGRFALPVTYLVARLRGKPFVLWTGIWMRLQTAGHRLLLPLTRYVYRHADAIVVYGEHVKRYLVSEGVPAERVFVGPHAVDNNAYSRTVPGEEKARLRGELGISPDQKVILYLGRLEEVKGLPYLLEAFASLRRDDTVLIVAGTGSELASLKQCARERGLTGQVVFPGYIEPDAAVAYYGLAHIYVLPSIATRYFKEPWGLVVNEAMNQGVPVVASDSVGAAAGGLILDGVNGLVVPERDSAALACALETILDDPDLRRKLGRNARETIAQWDNERMVLGFRQAVEYARLRQ